MIFAITALGALTAGFVQAVTGFGGSIIMMLCLPYFLSMKVSAALAGLITIPVSFAVAFTYRKKIMLREMVLPTLLYLVSSAICIKIAAKINLDSIKAVFGTLLIALAVYFWFFASRIRIRASLTSATVCGGASGITGGLFGIGGPLMVLYFLAVCDDKEKYLGTISLVFFTTELYSAVMRFAGGIINVRLFPVILCGFCAILLGRLIGGAVVNRLNGETMKKLIYILLATSGIITILRALGVM